MLQECWIDTIEGGFYMKKAALVVKVCVLMIVSMLVLNGNAYAADGIVAFEQLAYNVLPGQPITIMPIAQRIDEDLIYSWSSDDESIAKVLDGTVNGIEPGETIIRCEATTESGKLYQASYILTVYQPVTVITAVTPEYTNLYCRTSSLQLIEVTIEPENATNKKIIWESSDENVAICFGNEYILPWGPGKCVFTGTAADGSGVSVQIKVTVPDVYVTHEDIKITDTEGFVFGFYENSKQLWSPSYNGDAFTYEKVRSRSDLEYIRLIPQHAGKGTITWQDYKGKVVRTVNITVEQSAIYDDISFPPTEVCDLLNDPEKAIGVRTNFTGQVVSSESRPIEEAYTYAGKDVESNSYGLMIVGIGEQNKQYFAFEYDEPLRIGRVFKVYGTVQDFVEYTTETGLSYSCPLLTNVKVLVTE